MIERKQTENKIILDSQYVLNEIEQQPKVWEKTYTLVEEHEKEIQAFIKGYDEVIFTGAGTSEFVGNTVYRDLGKKGVKNIYSIGTTDILSNPEYYFDKTKKTILVSCARSGNSPESVAVVNLAEQFLEINVKHLILTCNPKGELAQFGRNHERAYCLLMPEGTNDLSYAMTSSFSSMLLSSYLIFSSTELKKIKNQIKWASEMGEKILNENSKVIKDIVNNRKFERLVYLGSGCLKGLAQEAALKALELSAGKLSVMYDSPLGYRHGPSSFVKDKYSSLIVCFFSGDTYTDKYTLDMLKEMRDYQNPSNYFISFTVSSSKEIALNSDFVLELEGDGVTECMIALPYILAAQMIAVYRSWLYGIGCDIPFGTYETTTPVSTIIYPIIS